MAYTSSRDAEEGNDLAIGDSRANSQKLGAPFISVFLSTPVGTIGKLSFSYIGKVCKRRQFIINHVRESSAGGGAITNLGRPSSWVRRVWPPPLPDASRHLQSLARGRGLSVSDRTAAQAATPSGTRLQRYAKRRGFDSLFRVFALVDRPQSIPRSLPKVTEHDRLD
eukprot:5431678-Amphidinium_carterae.1